MWSDLQNKGLNLNFQLNLFEFHKKDESHKKVVIINR